MYEGTFKNGKPFVMKSGYEFPVDESFNYFKSFSGFSWGNTKGSEQLAFAILMEEYGFDFAESNYKDFTVRVVHKLDATCNFKLSRKEIEFWKRNPK